MVEVGAGEEKRLELVVEVFVEESEGWKEEVVEGWEICGEAEVEVVLGIEVFGGRGGGLGGRRGGRLGVLGELEMVVGLGSLGGGVT